MAVLGRSTLVAVVLITGLVLGSLSCASAQGSYPSSPITMVVAFAPGGAADLSARALSEGSHAILGQSIAVKNVAGAAGATGFTEVAQAKPDGYTLIYATQNLVQIPHMQNVPYKALEDFSPIITLAGFPTIVVVRADSPFKTAKDLIDHAKQNPGKVRYSSSGFGSLHHMLVEKLAQVAAVDMTHVPFQSLGEGVTALLGGHVEASTCVSSDVLAHLKENRVRAIGMFLGERDKQMPDIPTFKEQGYDIVAFGWWGVAAPKGTPDAVVTKLHDAFKKGSAEGTAFDKLVKDLKFSPLYLSTKDTKERWTKDFEQYAAIAKTLKK